MRIPGSQRIVVLQALRLLLKFTLSANHHVTEQQHYPQHEHYPQDPTTETPSNDDSCEIRMWTIATSYNVVFPSANALRKVLTI